MIRLLVLLVAFSVLVYPSISTWLNEKNSSRAVASYDENVAKLQEEERCRMLEDAREYNQRLVGSTALLDPFAQEETGEVPEADAAKEARDKEREEYQSLLNTDVLGTMGYVEIPCIDVRLPIYHGTKEAVLQVGIGHLQGTSLPVGGESTHTVLTGHRGLPSKKLFTDLNLVKEGDVFFIKVLGETLAYEVDQILTVLPEETKELGVQEGKDLATLITCTPYSVNTHRLLVRGHRIPYEEAKQIESQTQHTKRELPVYQAAFLLGVAVIILVLLLAWLLGRRKKRKE